MNKTVLTVIIVIVLVAAAGVAGYALGSEHPTVIIMNQVLQLERTRTRTKVLISKLYYLILSQSIQRSKRPISTPKIVTLTIISAKRAFISLVLSFMTQEQKQLHQQTIQPSVLIQAVL